MEEKHRQLIKDNLEYLVQLTDYTLLMDECIRTNVMTPAFKPVIEEVDSIKHYYLIDEITRRGPTAFAKFTNILKNHFIDAYNLLMVSTNPANNVFDKANKDKKMAELKSSKKPPPAPQAAPARPSGQQSRVLLPYPLESIRTTNNVKRATNIKRNSNTHLGEYKMTGPRGTRGCAFLINNVNFADPAKYRTGAEIDTENLLSLFRQMGFTIFYQADVTKTEFESLVQQLFDYLDTNKHECLIFMLMSHGTKYEEVEFVDATLMKLKDVLKKFEISTPSMNNLPKCIMFPFCRGEVKDPGVAEELENASPSSSENIFVDGTAEYLRKVNKPRHSDLIITFSTLWDYAAFRDGTRGSWYVDTMCDIWSQHAHDTHLEDLLKLVGKKLSKKRSSKDDMQIANYQNVNFSKALYFNPGVWVDEDGTTKEWSS